MANEKNQVKAVDPNVIPSSGTYTLTIGGHTTANINYNDSAGTIKSAFEALSSVGSGNSTVVVDAATNLPTITLVGAKANTNVGPLTVASALSGPGTDPIVEYPVLGVYPGAYLGQTFLLAGFSTLPNAPATSGYITLNGLRFYYNTTSSQMASILTAQLQTIYGTDVTVDVSGGYSGSAANDYVITYKYKGDFFGGPIATPVIGATTLAGAGGSITPTITVTSSGLNLAGGTAQTATITLDPNNTSGNVQVVGPAATTTFAYNAAASAVATALTNAYAGFLPTFAGLVTGSAGGPYTVTFPDQYPHEGLLTTGSFSVNKGTLSRSVLLEVEQLAEGGAQNVVFIGSAQSIAQVGTGSIDTNDTNTIYRATLNRKKIEAQGSTSTDTTASLLAIDWATAATVFGDVGKVSAAATDNSLTFTGPATGEPFTLSLTAIGGLGTVTDVVTTTTPSGPNWLTAIDNYDIDQAPGNGDTFTLQSTNVSILYGLDQFGTDPLLNFNVDLSYTGSVGLPELEGQQGAQYAEYLPKTLVMPATNVAFGIGSGAGSPFFRWDSGSHPSTIEVFGTGQPVNSNGYALVYSNSASAVSDVPISIVSGFVGIAPYTGQSAKITLTIGFNQNLQSDATVFCGQGVTHGPIVQTGGTVTISSSCPSLALTGGSMTVTTKGAIATTATVYTGSLYYNGPTMPTSLTIGSGGILDFTRDNGVRTASGTPITVNKGAKISDPNGRLQNNPVIFYAGCRIKDVDTDFGPNRYIVILDTAPGGSTVNIPTSLAVAKDYGSTSSVKATWTDTNSGLARYRLRYSTHSAGVWTTLGETAKGATSFQVPLGTLSLSGNYDFEIQAFIEDPFAGEVASAWTSIVTQATSGLLYSVKAIWGSLSLANAGSGIDWATATAGIIANSALNNTETTKDLNVTQFFDYSGGQNEMLNDATITGIIVRLIVMSTSGAITSTLVQLIVGGSVAGTNQAASEAWPSTSALNEIVYGGPNDLMGLTSITPAQFNAIGTNFGVAIAVTSSADGETAYLLGATIIGFYTRT